MNKENRKKTKEREREKEKSKGPSEEAFSHWRGSWRTECFANEKSIDQLSNENHFLLSSFSRFHTATITREPCTFFNFVNFSASKRIRILRTCVLFHWIVRCRTLASRQFVARVLRILAMLRLQCTNVKPGRGEDRDDCAFSPLYLPFLL